MSAALKILRAGDKGDCVVDRLVSHRAAISLLAHDAALHRLPRWREARSSASSTSTICCSARWRCSTTTRCSSACARQFDYIFVDEFQDTDRMQARIIERLARDARRVRR